MAACATAYWYWQPYNNLIPYLVANNPSAVTVFLCWISVDGAFWENAENFVLNLETANWKITTTVQRCCESEWKTHDLVLTRKCWSWRCTAKDSYSLQKITEEGCVNLWGYVNLQECVNVWSHVNVQGCVTCWKRMIVSCWVPFISLDWNAWQGWWEPLRGYAGLSPKWICCQARKSKCIELDRY